MVQNLYVTGAERRSGKSIIALSLMEMLCRKSQRTGFFRPVIRTNLGKDPVIDLITARYQLPVTYEQMYGCTIDEALEYIAADRIEDLLKRILGKFKTLQNQCDLMLCLGTDYTDGASALEFDFNADVANNLGCLILPVVRGLERQPQQIVNATAVFHKSLQERKCDILATFINRVEHTKLDAVEKQIQAELKTSTPCYVLPELSQLSNPTISDVAKTLNADCIFGEEKLFNREIKNYKIAAMELPDFLDHIEPGSLLITPGDRSDIILGSLMSYPSSTYPQIAGLLLSGGMQPAKQVIDLIKGLGKLPVAVLSVPTDTFTTAINVSQVRATLNARDDRKIAASLGLFETHLNVTELEQKISSARSMRVTPLMFEHDLIQKARAEKKHVVLPEGGEERILRAAEILSLRSVVDITLLGNPEEVTSKINEFDLRLDNVKIIDPVDSNLRQQFASTYFQQRQHKGISEQSAFDTMADVSYFGTMMVHHGLADAMVSGSVHTTQHTIRPAFEVIKTKPGVKLVSSVFFMCLEDRVLVFGDCAVNPNPNAEQLADIAVNAASTAQKFAVEPRIAMLSYSTGSSGKGEAVDKVREATRIARELRPDLKIEGPIQYDAAVDASVARTKLPNSDVAGSATVFIFPDLNTGNNTYKAVQRSANAVAVGPVLQGLNKPINDLSRGCTVADIVNTVAISAIQAQDD